MAIKNLSPLDRAVRGIVAVVAVTTTLLFPEIIGDPLLQGILIAFGLLNAISLVFGNCLVYQVAGISTYRDPDAKDT
ncbi:MAG: DUF2892 domain-containing protein [Halieaceae bacterium]|nr:DUF2892 domain-containing protein [Halieaceae bacterium]